MVYLVFDLDETLGQFYTPYFFLCDLAFEKTTLDLNPSVSKPPPPELVPFLKKAYKEFISLIASAEVSDHPLGILRPGIISLFQKIAELKSKGIVQTVLIYSNNANLPSLEFARDVLEEAVGSPGLICDCIHWYHPDRIAELIPNSKGDFSPGLANKTWDVLSTIMKEGPCKAPEDLDPSQVYFFDDMDHPDLKRTLGPQYIQVTPYKYKIPASRLEILYYIALGDANIYENPVLEDIYLDYVGDQCGGTRSASIEDHVELHKQHTGKTAHIDSRPPEPDVGFLAMKTCIEGLFPTKGGGCCSYRRRVVRQKRIRQTRKYRKSCHRTRK